MQDAYEIKTGRLYETDSYMEIFESRICFAAGKEVVLEETLFFPEEGGQCSDTGTLYIEGFDSPVKVRSVIIKGDEIVHLTDGSFDGKDLTGLKVRGEIDFARRYDLMQQHSGEHILSGLVFEKFGISNSGFHLSEKEMTVDYPSPLSEEQLLYIEKEANSRIRTCAPSMISFPDEDERKQMSYRSKIDLPGKIRVVTFPGLDSCACCAPHVRNTGEIGSLRIVSSKPWKGGVRLFVVCGSRADAFAANEHAVLTEAAGLFSTSPGSVPDRIRKIQDENRSLTYKMRQAETEKLCRMLLSAENGAVFAEECDGKACQDAVLKAVKKSGKAKALFVGSDGKYRYCIAGPDDTAWKLQGLLSERFGAKGGGRDGIFNGSVSGDGLTTEEILSVFDEAVPERK